jgi:hypothetical protein
MMHTCTLVLEYNYGKPEESLGSVWLFNGDGRANLQEDSPLGTLPSWVKVVGPIQHELATSIHAALKRFLEQSGVVVIDEGVAD